MKSMNYTIKFKCSTAKATKDGSVKGNTLAGEVGITLDAEITVNEANNDIHFINDCKNYLQQTNPTINKSGAIISFEIIDVIKN